MLDRHRTFLYAKGTSKYYLYDLALLGGIDSISDALRLIVECDRRELVAHDIVQWLVTAKWGLFTQHYVIREAILYAIFISLYIMSTLKVYLPPVISLYQGWIDLALLFLSLRYIFRLILEWHHRGFTMPVAMSIVRADKFTGPVFIIVNGILFLRYVCGMGENSISERVLETIGSVLLWIRVLYFAEAQFETVGLTMSIVRRMVADITVYVAVQFVFLIGFAHAMTITFRGEKPSNPNYGSPMRSFATLLFFIFNVDQGSVFDEEEPDRRALAMTLLAIYESLVVVVFLNLVIAVMTTGFEDVMSNAKTEWLLVRAKICVRMEDQTSASLFTTRTKRHVRRLRAMKRTAIVMERASGENEVSLPVSLLPPPLEIHRLFSLATEWIWRWWSPTPSPSSPQPSLRGTNSYGTLLSPSRKINRNNSDSVVEILTGKEEELFCVGKFIRYSVTSAGSSTSTISPAVTGGGLSTSATQSSSAESGDASVMKDPSILGDDQLIATLRSIILELERRKLESV